MDTARRLDVAPLEAQARPVKQLNLRLPDDIHERLQALAAAEHRSLNAQVLALIEQATRDTKDTRPRKK